MLRRFGVCVIISLLMMLIYNSEIFTIEKRVQIIDVYKDGTALAVYTSPSTKPQNYTIHSSKKFGEWETIKEMSPIGSTVLFVLLLCIIVILAEALIGPPEPFNPYKT